MKFDFDHEKLEVYQDEMLAFCKTIKAALSHFCDSIAPRGRWGGPCGAEIRVCEAFPRALPVSAHVSQWQVINDTEVVASVS